LQIEGYPQQPKPDRPLFLLPAPALRACDQREQS
jgi:hypothetical protein